MKIFNLKISCYGYPMFTFISNNYRRHSRNSHKCSKISSWSIRQSFHTQTETAVRQFHFKVVIVWEILKKMIHIFLNRRRVETKILNITILNPSDDSDSSERFSYSSVPFIKVCYLKFYKAASIVERRKGYF